MQEARPTAPYEYCVVADAETAPAMARAFLTHGWQPRRSWVLGVTVIFSIGFAYLAVTNRAASTGDRLIGSLLFFLLVLPIAASLWLLLMLIGYSVNLRNLRATTFAGAVLQTGFDDDSFISSNPLAANRYAYASVRSIVVHRGFVFLRLWGSTTIRTFPEQLIPPDARQRLQPRPDPATLVD